MKYALASFSFLLLLVSCREDEQKTQSKPKPKENVVVVEDGSAYDTIVDSYGQGYLDSIPDSKDTTFLINGEPHTLHIELKLNGTDTVSYDEKPILKDSVVRIHRYYGRDIEYLFRLYDSEDNQLWEKVFYKKEYMKELGSIVAQSNMRMPNFETYLASTDQVVLTQVFAVPDSDVGVEGILYFENNGDCQMKFHRWYMSGGSECSVQPSKDNKCLLTCSEIITAKGKTISLKRPNATIAGNMFIGNSHIFVSYVFDNDSKELGGRLYNSDGKLVKEFDYQGYSGALSYEIPVIHINKYGKYYFVDETNNCFHVISENSPSSVKRIAFSSLRVAPDPSIQDTVLEMSSEIINHKFGLNLNGDIEAHQMKLYGGVWQFYDEIKH